MSYLARARRHHIREMQDYLELLLKAAQRTSPLSLPVDADFAEWKLRQALVAADKFPDEAEGRYAGLREKVSVGFRVVAGQLYIHAESKILTSRALTEMMNTDPEDTEALAEIVAAINVGIEEEQRTSTPRPNIWDTLAPYKRRESPPETDNGAKDVQ